MPIPSPNSGESQDDFISRCIGNETMKKEYGDNKQRTAVCFSSWRDKYGGKAPEKANDWHLIEFFAPINEFKDNVKGEFESDFIIRGIAINETTTHNGHKYIAEELEKASTQLINKKLLVDHDNRVKSIKGIITKSWFNPTKRSIEFEGVVKDKNIKEMIRDGRLSDVSIGAYAKDLVKSDDGSKIAKGLEIVELSFVAVPADSKANFAAAMDNSFKLKERMRDLSLVENMHCPECNKEFESKAEMKKHMKDKHNKETESYSEILGKTGERRSGEMTEENKQVEELTQNNSKLMEELSTLRNVIREQKVNQYKLLCVEKKVKEKDISKVNNETIDFLIEQLKDIVIENKIEKIQTKSLVSEEEVNVASNLVIERADSGRGYAIWAMPDIDKWKKLHNDPKGRLKTW